jgi:hypothetical protein
MRALFAVALLVATPLSAQVCSSTVYTRTTACPPGTSGVCQNAAAQLTWSQLDGSLTNLAQVCTNAPNWLTIGGDLCGTASAPTVCANAVTLGTDTTGGYAGSASEAGPATTALALTADPAACPAGQFATDLAASGALTCGTPAGGDHGGLTGLADDDHPQYALLAGRSGGQTLLGGTAGADKLTLDGHSGTAGFLAVTADGGLEWRNPSSGAPWKAAENADGLLVWTWVFGRFAFEGNNGHIYIAKNGRIGWTDQQFDPTVTPGTWLSQDTSSGESGVVKVWNLLELMPLDTPPTCEPARIYFDSSGTFCGCAGGSWRDMTPAAGGTCS